MVLKRYNIRINIINGGVAACALVKGAKLTASFQVISFT